MYGEAAVARRRCNGTTRSGAPCRAWARWGDEGQRCVAHGGHAPTGPRASRRARYTPCTCAAYRFPHRPGAGLCRWPEAPVTTCPTPAGTHRPGVRRRWRKGKHGPWGGYFAYERRQGRAA